VRAFSKRAPPSGPRYSWDWPTTRPYAPTTQRSHRRGATRSGTRTSLSRHVGLTVGGFILRSYDGPSRWSKMLPVAVVACVLAGYRRRRRSGSSDRTALSQSTTEIPARGERDQDGTQNERAENSSMSAANGIASALRNVASRRMGYSTRHGTTRSIVEVSPRSRAEPDRTPSGSLPPHRSDHDRDGQLWKSGRRRICGNSSKHQVQGQSGLSRT